MPSAVTAASPRDEPSLTGGLASGNRDVNNRSSLDHPVADPSEARNTLPRLAMPDSRTDGTERRSSGTSPLTTNSPDQRQSPTSPRRRAHTVAVSIRPPSGSSTTPQPPIPAALGEHGGPDDEEANLTGRGDAPVRRKRGSSVVERLRNSTISTGSRNRKESDAGHSGPVRYEVLPSKGRRSGEQARDQGFGREEEELDDDVVGVLDCIDSEISTVNHLQNVTNSIMIPHLPALWSRRPEVKLNGNEDRSETKQMIPASEMPAESDHEAAHSRQRASTVAGLYGTPRPSSDIPRPPRPEFATFSSHQPVLESSSSTEYPPIPKIAGSSESLVPPMKRKTTGDSLDHHVRQVLRESKRDKAKKALQGLWVFLKTPMGVFAAIYGVLVVFWGAAIIFFLAGWIPVANKWWQDRWVEISSQIVNGLFTITGVGLIPWRAKDTYRISVIWTLRERVRRRRKQQGLPPVADLNDIEDPRDQEEYVSVLNDKERANLQYQQEMFAKSQTWYRPHATATHRAFPMSWALWNTILMDLNSAFQCMLCGTMWGLSQYERPAWTTGCLIPLSFLCGIGAGILIWQGSARTKKRETVEDKLRKALGVPLAIAVPQTASQVKLSGDSKVTPRPGMIAEEESGQGRGEGRPRAGT